MYRGSNSLVLRPMPFPVFDRCDMHTGTNQRLEVGMAWE